MPRYNPKWFYLILLTVLQIAATVAMIGCFQFRPLFAYAASLNILTLMVYGYDKRRAIVQKGRVPEAVLHLLALIGGSPAALAGQLVFRHKLKKWRFQLVFVGIVCLQIAGIGLWIYLRQAR